VNRLSARGRLTIVHTGLVVAAGIALTALTYLLMRQNLGHRLVVRITTPGTSGPPLPAIPGPDELADAALSALLSQAAIALVVVAVLAALLGWLVAGRILRPIRAIATTAARLSAENIGERVPVSPPADELAALARTINGMLDRLQRGITERDRVLAGQRMFTANAAHELRTPLTTMRTAVEVTLDGEPTRAELLGMAADVGVAVEQSRRTIDGLLTLARSQSPTGEPAVVDLAEVATRMLDGVSLTTRVELAPAPVRGQEELLERLVANLVGNAVRHNHPGGHVEVTTGVVDAVSYLRVANSGRVITAEEADRLPEPFVRSAPARTGGDRGAGLGLSIVRAIAEAHEGDLTVVPRPGGGLDVTVRLGRAPSVAGPCRTRSHPGR
jgi:signal transduction histidine kinase